MKSITILISVLWIFSANGFSQDTLILNNQELRLINIIALKESSIQYYPYSKDLYTATFQPNTIDINSVYQLNTSVDPFYKNALITIKTFDNNIIQDRLIGMDGENVKLVGNIPGSGFKNIYSLEAGSIKQITKTKQGAVPISASIGALLFGIVGYSMEDAINSSNKLDADLENFGNFITFNWGAPAVEPEVVDRNRFVDTMVGAIAGAAIGAAIGTLFKDKININSSYDLKNALKSYKREYPSWKNKVNVRKY